MNFYLFNLLNLTFTFSVKVTLKNYDENSNRSISTNNYFLDELENNQEMISSSQRRLATEIEPTDYANQIRRSSSLLPAKSLISLNEHSYGK